MAQRTCSVDDCTRIHAAKGYCQVHYWRWRHNGDPLKLKRPPAPPDGFKRCSGCREVLSVDKFGVNNATRDGRHTVCLECIRPRNRRTSKRWTELNPDAHRVRMRDWYQRTGYRNLAARKYGLTLDQYDAMAARAGGLCEICKRPERATSSSGVLKHLSVDHDHATGEVRGLLCTGCNTALGAFAHDPALLLAAIHYLED